MNPTRTPDAVKSAMSVLFPRTIIRARCDHLNSYKYQVFLHVVDVAEYFSSFVRSVLCIDKATIRGTSKFPVFGLVSQL
jgi:hypothetical protein